MVNNFHGTESGICAGFGPVHTKRLHRIKAIKLSFSFKFKFEFQIGEKNTFNCALSRAGFL